MNNSKIHKANMFSIKYFIVVTLNLNEIHFKYIFIIDHTDNSKNSDLLILSAIFVPTFWLSYKSIINKYLYFPLSNRAFPSQHLFLPT